MFVAILSIQEDTVIVKRRTDPQSLVANIYAMLKSPQRAKILLQVVPILIKCDPPRRVNMKMMVNIIHLLYTEQLL